MSTIATLPALTLTFPTPELPSSPVFRQPSNEPRPRAASWSSSFPDQRLSTVLVPSLSYSTCMHESRPDAMSERPTKRQSLPGVFGFVHRQARALRGWKKRSSYVSRGRPNGEGEQWLGAAADVQVLGNDVTIALDHKRSSWTSTVREIFSSRRGRGTWKRFSARIFTRSGGTRDSLQRTGVCQDQDDLDATVG